MSLQDQTSEMSTARNFAVCCTEQVPTAVIDELLRKAYAGGALVDYSPRLKVLNSVENPDGRPTMPPVTEAQLVQGSTVSELGIAVRRLARKEGSHIDERLFVILDHRSVSDKTVLLVEMTSDAEPHLIDGKIVKDQDFEFDTLRTDFVMAGCTLNSLDVGVTSLGEQQCLAVDGVLKSMFSSEVEGSLFPESPKGNPGPRRKLERPNAH